MWVTSSKTSTKAIIDQNIAAKVTILYTRMSRYLESGSLNRRTFIM
jgi:hypothetical protein